MLSQAIVGPKIQIFGPTQRRSLLTDFGGYFLVLTFCPLKIELGTACGKLFRCSTMAILDAGDSDILAEQQS